MAANKSILKVLQIMDGITDRQKDDQILSHSSQSSKATFELDLKLKMVKENNNARSQTPTPSTKDGCSSSSLDAERNKVDAQEELIRKKLSMRAYHLPGNSWCQDLGMYIKNNHLLCGICCHHHLHPVKFRHRLVILVGSLAFGLSITNAVYLYYLWGRDTDHDGAAFSISLGGEVVENITTNTLTIDISYGMAMLWTIGAASHSFFDLALWHMIACGCVKQKCCRVAGWNMAVAIVMLLVALTSFVVVVRAYESGEEANEYDHNANIEHEFAFGDGNAEFQYLYGYLVELVLSLLVYTPLAQILLFTGILGCGALPVLGGRSNEMRKCKIRDTQSTRADAIGIQKV